MWHKLKAKLEQVSTMKAIIAINGAILMHFFPDEDNLIIFILGALGITEIFNIKNDTN